MVHAHDIGKPLKGFEDISRYWDKYHALAAAKILPGEYYVTESNELITTVLGSCVSACIRDKIFGVGGMNHFMLPLNEDGKGWGGHDDFLSTANRYGNYAMEHMINDIIKHGGHKKNLEAKIVGGGQIINSMTDIGRKNIQFVEDYLKTENIPLVGEDVGQIYPRKVVYFPRTGKVRVKKLMHLHNDTIIKRETKYMSELKTEPVSGEVELF